MSDTSLQTFSGLGDDLPLALARSWAESTARLVVRAREDRRRFNTLEEAHERMDVDGLTWGDVEEAQRTVWSTECLLILSASNLETWIGQLYVSRGRPRPPKIELLKELRNTIEHLHESVFEDETWTATPSSPHQTRRGVGALPDGMFDVWSGPASYVPVERLESMAADLLRELWRELDDYARDWFEMIRSGR